MSSPITQQIGTSAAQHTLPAQNQAAAARQPSLAANPATSAQASQIAAQTDTVKPRPSDKGRAIQQPQKRVEGSFSPQEAKAAKKEAKTEAPVRKDTQNPEEPVDVVA